MAEELRPPDDRMTVPGLDGLKVMADPLRMRLIEALRASPATVKELAERLGVRPKSLYYHIGLLERHKLIRVVETRLVSGILEKRYRASAFLFEFSGLTGAEGREAAARGTEGFYAGIFALTAEELRESIASRRMEPAGLGTTPDRDLTAEWQLLRLTTDEASAFAAELGALVAHYSSGGQEVVGSRATYRFLQMLFPTYGRVGPSHESRKSDLQP